MKHYRNSMSPWETGELYIGTGMKSTARAVKDLEMSARRAWHFGRLCALYTERVGHREASRLPVHPVTPDELRAAKAALGDVPHREPLLRNPAAWRWAYGLWRRGHLESSIHDVLDQIPTESANRARRAMT